MSLPRRLPRIPTAPGRVGVAVITGTALVAGILVGGLATAGSAQADVASPADRRVVSANEFINSVGVNVHTYYNDTSYADTNRVQTLLQGLGVRAVRDGLVPDRPDEVTALKKLGAAGIRSMLILGGTRNAATQVVDPAQLSALSEVRPFVDAVEATNEYDCSGDPNWATHQRAYSQQLVTELQARTDLKSLPIVAPSFCRPESVAEFGASTGIASVTNAHNYSNGQAPELALAGRLPTWATTQNASLPMVVTETGFHNALNSPAPSVGVTEATAADYTVRALLESSRLGVTRTYLYELLDQKVETGLRDPEQHYGLVRQDGSVKPAYTAVKNLLADLALGSPANVTPGPAQASDVVSVRGGGSQLRTVSVTDPSGGGETLALWMANPVENTAHQRPADTATPVRVTVTGTHTATTRQPSRGNEPAAVGTGTAFTVPVNGGVTLLHLAPSTTAAGTNSCTAQPGYGALAAQLGAVAADELAPAGWTGSPAAASALPDGVNTGTQVAANGQQKRLAVPGAPTSWTVALWQRTDASAANFSTFMRAVGAGGPAAGGLLRTYDLAGDVPSHMQLSGYGLPTAGAGYGSETWGQALSGTWHLLSLSVGGGRATIAIDGVEAGSVASGAGALTGVDVGSLSGSYRGALAGLTVFNRALATSDVAKLARTSPGSCGLVAGDSTVPAAAKAATKPAATPAPAPKTAATPAPAPKTAAKTVVPTATKATTTTKAAKAAKAKAAKAKAAKAKAAKAKAAKAKKAKAKKAKAKKAKAKKAARR